MTDVKHIGDLTPDPRNARKHNPRNVGMVEKALREVGAARSIVIESVCDIRQLFGEYRIDNLPTRYLHSHHDAQSMNRMRENLER